MTSESPRTIESWPIDNLIPYSRNAKIHDPAQIITLAKQIKEYGWDQPIVVDSKGNIIKGHGRRLAALDLGMKFVPVIVRDDLTPEQIKAARIADNRIAQGDVDTELLKRELDSLLESGVDLADLGFTDVELDMLTSDLDDMDMSAVIDDLDYEVEEQTNRVEKKTKEVEDTPVSLATAFGFKVVSTDDARKINNLMGQIENESGLEGAEAFMKFVSDIVD